MSVDGNFFEFSGELKPLQHTHAEQLTVADSWLVNQGQVIGLDRHFARFRASVANDSVTCEQLDSFERSVRAAIPRVGTWFPRIEYRVECDAGRRLFFRLRGAPELTETVTLWTHPEADPRTSPLVKGPDLSVCQQLRRAANLHGGDEAVLLDAEGFICEGALSSLVWWRDDVLLLPDDSTAWLPSITRELVVELAQQAGFAVEVTRAKPSDLNGCEVWSLSSLQSVRGVTAWPGVEILQPTRHRAFRKRMQLLATEL